MARAGKAAATATNSERRQDPRARPAPAERGYPRPLQEAAPLPARDACSLAATVALERQWRDRAAGRPVHICTAASIWISMRERKYRKSASQKAGRPVRGLGPRRRRLAPEHTHSPAASRHGCRRGCQLGHGEALAPDCGRGRRRACEGRARALPAPAPRPEGVRVRTGRLPGDRCREGDSAQGDPGGGRGPGCEGRPRKASGCNSQANSLAWRPPGLRCATCTAALEPTSAKEQLPARRGQRPVHPPRPRRCKCTLAKRLVAGPRRLPTATHTLSLPRPATRRLPQR